MSAPMPENARVDLKHFNVKYHYHEELFFTYLSFFLWKTKKQVEDPQFGDSFVWHRQEWQRIFQVCYILVPSRFNCHFTAVVTAFAQARNEIV